jgi:hypothetical protein
VTARIVIECHGCDATWQSDPQWKNSLATMRMFREFAAARGWRSLDVAFGAHDYCPNCAVLMGLGGAA